MASSDRPWPESGELWHGILESMSDGVAVVDAAGKKRVVNRALCEMTGFARDELVGLTPPFPYWPEEHHGAIVDVFDRALAGDVTDSELIFRRKSGERFPVLVHPATVESGGSAVAYVATIKDISERKRIEQALRESEERWRSIAENPFDFVVIIDRDYRYTYVNHTAPGLATEDLLDKATPFDFVQPDHHDAMREAFERAFDEGVASAYDVYVPLTKTWYSSIVGPIFKDGRVTAASILTRDVTLQKQAEQALRQTQRMETLGRFASGIAHDFNNLLVPILGNAGLALARLPPDEPIAECVRDVVQAATRARELVSRVLLFARPAAERYQRVRVQDVAHEVIAFIRAAAPSTVEVKADIHPDSPPVMALQVEIHQVITNLCANAVKALEKTGGHVQVVVEPTTIEATPSGPPGRTSRAAVRIAVSDDGPGIATEDLPYVFDPFFSTRREGEGTGLGLSIVHAIATRLGGDVTAQSQPGAGARFEVRLPAASG